jgi:hypothetical protein
MGWALRHVDRSVSTGTRLWAGHSGIQGSIPSGNRGVFSTASITGPGVHLTKDYLEP